MFDRPNLTIEQKQARARLSQRAGRLMNTLIMQELNRDQPRMRAFQAAVESGCGFEGLDQKWRLMILAAEEESGKGDHK